jgi:acyl carrier protein
VGGDEVHWEIVSGQDVLEEGKVVALCTGLKFQELRRTILEHILPNAGKSTALSTAVKPREQSRPTRASRALETVPSPAVGKTAFSDIIETIASEVGIAQNEITEDSAFAELGVDSLLTITILDKLRRTTDTELPTSLFHTYTTVGALRAFFDGENAKQVTVMTQHSRSSSVESSDTESFSLIGGTGSEIASSVSTPHLTSHWLILVWIL